MTAESRVQENADSTGARRVSFTGKPYSSSIGLYYHFQRWYDPEIGRFISQDPIAGRLSNPQSLNPYVYVRNLPTLLTDPSGLTAVFVWPKWENPFGLPPIFAQIATAGGPYGAPVAFAAAGIYIGGTLLMGALTAALTPKPTPTAPTPAPTPAPVTQPTIVPTIPTITSVVGPMTAGPGTTLTDLGKKRPEWRDYPPPGWTPPPGPKGDELTTGPWRGKPGVLKTCAVAAVVGGVFVGTGLIAPKLAKGEYDLGDVFVASTAGFATTGALFFLCAGVFA